MTKRFDANGYYPVLAGFLVGGVMIILGRVVTRIDKRIQ